MAKKSFTHNFFQCVYILKFEVTLDSPFSISSRFLILKPTSLKSLENQVIDTNLSSFDIRLKQGMFNFLLIFNAVLLFILTPIDFEEEPNLSLTTYFFAFLIELIFTSDLITPTDLLLKYSENDNLSLQIFSDFKGEIIISMSFF